jgi:hypothetical protein
MLDHGQVFGDIARVQHRTDYHPLGVCGQRVGEHQFVSVGFRPMAPRGCEFCAAFTNVADQPPRKCYVSEKGGSDREAVGDCATFEQLEHGFIDVSRAAIMQDKDVNIISLSFGEAFVKTGAGVGHVKAARDRFGAQGACRTTDCAPKAWPARQCGLLSRGDPTGSEEQTHVAASVFLISSRGYIRLTENR